MLHAVRRRGLHNNLISIWCVCQVKFKMMKNMKKGTKILQENIKKVNWLCFCTNIISPTFKFVSYNVHTHIFSHVVGVQHHIHNILPFQPTHKRRIIVIFSILALCASPKNFHPNNNNIYRVNGL